MIKCQSRMPAVCQDNRMNVLCIFLHVVFQIGLDRTHTHSRHLFRTSSLIWFGVHAACDHWHVVVSMFLYLCLFFSRSRSLIFCV